MFRRISVIGGDLRQLTLARMLISDGYDVLIYGFTKDIKADGIPQTDDLTEALDCDIVILPVPVSFDNKNINTPFSDSELPIDDLIEKINPLSILFGGRISDYISERLTARGIKHSDYMARDELAIRNAVPTAEGAIQIAISETPITLHGSKCLVLGYGKVGKTLSRCLNGLGAKTYVGARKYADLALIESHDCIPLTMNEAKTRIDEFDVIFNTVPALILTGEVLEKVRQDTLIIDLASKPGGIDFDAAAELGLRVIWALSLPGRVAPVTAGIIIKDTITNILSEMEV
ncbi:MAG: dipicolinate synthase subunit DpsA [Candidatus Ornithomonoglobus sp.]